MIARSLILAGALAALALPAPAHDGVEHGSAEEAARHLSAAQAAARAAEAAQPPTRFPKELGGPFALTDQRGETRTEADPEGRLQLLFFGYANCPGICSAALPRMAEMAEAAAEAGVPVVPVMITIDPTRDTPEGMVKPLAELSPLLVGLTGTEAQLEEARRLFQVEKKLVFTDPEYGPIYAHGSFIYLLDAKGGLLTLIPPILGAERGAEIIARYAAIATN